MKHIYQPPFLQYGSFHIPISALHSRNNNSPTTIMVVSVAMHLYALLSWWNNNNDIYEKNRRISRNSYPAYRKWPPLPSQTQYKYMQPCFSKIKIRREQIPNGIQNSLIYSVPALICILDSWVVDKDFHATGWYGDEDSVINICPSQDIVELHKNAQQCLTLYF